MVHLDDPESCLARIREGLVLFVELGDEQGVMTARAYEAMMQWWQRDLASATRNFAELQAAAQSDGNEWGDAFCGMPLGSAAWIVGDLAPAKEHNSRNLELFRRVGDLTMMAWTLLPLANIALASDELDEATALYDECLHRMGDLGDRHGVGAVLLGLGMTAHFRGEPEKAQSLLTEAQTNLREGGGGQGLSWPISNALVDTRTHDLLVEATNRYQASLDLPSDEWARMVCSDGESWRASARTDL